MSKGFLFLPPPFERRIAHIPAAVVVNPFLIFAFNIGG
jgi:hypothetical protein